MLLRSSSRAVAAFAALLLLLPAQVKAAEPSAEVRLVVHHRPGAGPATADLAAAAGARVVEDVPQLATQTVTVDADEAEAVSAVLEADPRVDEVFPDVEVRAFATAGRIPDDPLWPQQWGAARMRAPQAWARSTGSRDVVIAVLDTGVAGGHPDLQANVLTDGYDAIADQPVGPPGDVSGHGTHVAGIAAAAGDNGRGIAGLCWRCRILSVKVLDDAGRGSFTAIERGILWAVERGADVIVMSLGTDASTVTSVPPSRAVEHAAAEGVLLVAAAGNAGSTGKVWPAAYPEVIGVAASDAADARARFSNHGAWVDVAAPGVEIESTLPGGAYGRRSGTSMAAPQVAGALGLALSHAPQGPSAQVRAAQVRSALEATAVPVGGYVSTGRVDVSALLAVIGGGPSAPSAVTAMPGDASATVTWQPPATGAAAVTRYRVTAAPGGRSAEVAPPVTAATVSGLANGTAYTFTVAALDQHGIGVSSAPSAPVIPRPLRPAAFDGSPAGGRIPEGDPVAAAAAVSLRRFGSADGAQPGPRAAHAVLSRDDDFPDSLAGAPLSATGPLLFTGSRALPATTADELRRVLPRGATVYLLGGEAAIAEGVADRVSALGYEPRRLAGGSRVETSLAIADEVRRLHPGDRTLLIARAFGAPGNTTSGWADSVTGGAYGAAVRAPIVLTPTASVHPAVAAWVQRDAPTRSLLLGGEAALSSAVATVLPHSRRVAGPERTATAAAVATDLWGTPTDGARRYVVINGFDRLGWAHGLAAAGAAADARAPLLLVTPAVPEATHRLVAACGPRVELLLVGGSSALPAATVAELDRLSAGGC